MTAYLLDANHAGLLVTVGHPVRDRLLAAAAAGDRLNIHLLTITETVFGFSTLPRAEQNARLWAAVQPTLVLLGLDEENAVAAAALQTTLRRRGRQIGTVDAIIAVTALRDKLILLTTDRDFMAVPGLVTENWLQD